MNQISGKRLFHGGNSRPHGGYLTRFHGTAAHANEGDATLSPQHPAVVHGTTIFPKSIVAADRSPRLLVSGMHSAKLGRMVAKGPWRGMPIFHLTLVERETCPRSCAVYSACYGNAMPLARRHKYDEHLVVRLGGELSTLAREHRRSGFVVRLHNLGDFPDVPYAQKWLDWTYDLPPLRVFGYTAHPIDSAIGRVVATGNDMFPGRWAMRFSVGADTEHGPMQATTIWRKPEGPRVPEGIVCPAEQDHPWRVRADGSPDQKTAACATCGLCWSPSAAAQRIVFVGHGMNKRKPGATHLDRSAPFTAATGDLLVPPIPPPAVPVIPPSRQHDVAFLAALRLELEHHVRSTALIQAMIVIQEQHLASTPIEALAAATEVVPSGFPVSVPPLKSLPELRSTYACEKCGKPRSSFTDKMCAACAQSAQPATPSTFDLPSAAAVAIGIPVVPQPAPRRGGVRLLTEARTALLRTEFPAGVSLDGMVGRFNALPGLPGDKFQISQLCSVYLKLRRPAGFHWKEAPWTLQESLNEDAARLPPPLSEPEKDQIRPENGPSPVPLPPLPPVPAPEPALEDTALAQAMRGAAPKPTEVIAETVAPPKPTQIMTKNMSASPAPSLSRLATIAAVSRSLAAKGTAAVPRANQDDLAPVPVDFEQCRHWAAQRGIQFLSWDDLPRVNRKREDLLLPIFCRRFDGPGARKS